MNSQEAHHWTLILKLRSNIELEGDLQLAELELNHLLGCTPEPLNKAAFESLVHQGILAHADLRHCRSDGLVGYCLRVEHFDPIRLFQRLSFFELIVGETILFPEQWGIVRTIN